jgi:hypothetical protein
MFRSWRLTPFSFSMHKVASSVVAIWMNPKQRDRPVCRAREKGGIGLGIS